MSKCLVLFRVEMARSGDALGLIKQTWQFVSKWTAQCPTISTTTY